MTAPINIKPKDLQRVTGLSYIQCFRKLKAIREVNEKTQKQYVTAAEAADFLGLPTENFIKLLETNG